MLVAITAVIQVAEVALLAQFITLLVNPNLIIENPFTRQVYDLPHFTGDVFFLTFFAIGVRVFTDFSNAIGALARRVSMTLSQNVCVELQSALRHAWVARTHLKIDLCA